MTPPCLTLSATDTRRSFYDTILTQARANHGRKGQRDATRGSQPVRERKNGMIAPERQALGALETRKTGRDRCSERETASLPPEQRAFEAQRVFAFRKMIYSHLVLFAD